MRDGSLALRGVCVTFGALRAVDGVSLDVPAGERRAIIGPNGAGKTTLFNAIAGEVTPTAGAILLGGRDVTRLRTHQRVALGIGRTYQITNLFAELTIEDNLRLALRGLSRRKFSLLGGSAPGQENDAVAAALERCGLARRRGSLTRALSYGEQRQLEFALALASRPALLLLDEPAAGLSPAERVDIAATIRGLPRELTLILIEHDIDLALGLVDHVTCMHEGRILVEGTPDEIRANARVQEVYLGTPHHA
ncbi:MAG TPA: ABC transporter ATP-binding protein [Casimicrobiaceae bacterium]|nr:ABC transporter ATP-binding protein [Casimicrobiaceae bacterium]